MSNNLIEKEQNKDQDDKDSLYKVVETYPNQNINNSINAKSAENRKSKLTSHFNPKFAAKIEGKKELNKINMPSTSNYNENHEINEQSLPKSRTLNNSNNTSDYYKKYLVSLKETYFTTEEPETVIKIKNGKSDKIENLQNNLNESISTNHTVLTMSSNKNIFSRLLLRSLYDNYLDTKYQDISNLQKKYSFPFIPIEVKKNSTYFIIKSFNIENIHKAIKYGVWSTTYSGNILFDKAYVNAQSKGGEVYLFFSTNSTFAFQGIAKLKSKFQAKSHNFWKGSDKYKAFNGSFNIEWLIIKDVPNSSLDRIHVNNIPFSKLRNGVEIIEHDALMAINIYEKFYYCSSLVLSDFMRLDLEEKQQVDVDNSRKGSYAK